MYKKFEATKEYGFGEVWHLKGEVVIDESVPRGKWTKEAMKWFTKKIGKTLLRERLVQVGETGTYTGAKYHFHLVVIEPKEDGWFSSKSPEALEMAALCKKKKREND